MPHSSFDEGGWVSYTAFDAIVRAEPAEASAEGALLKLADGVSADDAMAALPPSWELETPTASADVINLLQVRSLPIYLALFLACLAIGAVAHALFTTARQRAHELAVLRALGMTLASNRGERVMAGVGHRRDRVGGRDPARHRGRPAVVVGDLGRALVRVRRTADTGCGRGRGRCRVPRGVLRVGGDPGPEGG
jgi:hypothetical protein